MEKELLQEECTNLRAEVQQLKQALIKNEFSLESFKNDDEKVKFYTGLPCFNILIEVFEFVSAFISHNTLSKLSKFQKFIIFLIKLRLACPIVDLAYRFKVSKSLISKTVKEVLHVMFVRLSPLIYWPQREDLHKTMSKSFRKYFGNKIAIIIDCFEIFIERPSNLKARAQTWSQYKHNNTVKYLIGIAPQGLYHTFHMDGEAELAINI